MRVSRITVIVVAALTVAFAFVGMIGSDDDVDALIDPNATVTPINDLVYNGYDQNLVNAGTADVPGTFEYSFFEEIGYSASIPTGQTAREYEIYFNFTPDDPAYETKTHVYACSVDIDKAPVDDVTTSINPTYSGNVYKQMPTLVDLSFMGLTPNKGPVDGNVDILMKSGYDGTSAGTQVVVVRVGGDPNFADGSTEVSYTINKAGLSKVSVDTIDYEPKYDGNVHIPDFTNIYFDSWSQDNGPSESKITISLKDGSDGISVGTQYIVVKVTGDTNFNDFEGEASYEIKDANSGLTKENGSGGNNDTIVTIVIAVTAILTAAVVLRIVIGRH